MNHYLCFIIILENSNIFPYSLSRTRFFQILFLYLIILANRIVLYKFYFNFFRKLNFFFE